MPTKKGAVTQTQVEGGSNAEIAHFVFEPDDGTPKQAVVFPVPQHPYFFQVLSLATFTKRVVNITYDVGTDGLGKPVSSPTAISTA